MQFHLAKTAEKELDEIFFYWAQRAGVAVADRIIDSIAERFSLLCDYSQLGRECDEIATGVRVFPTSNYLIYYRKKRGILEILHVFHAAREQERAFGNG
jgi:toxin ParE1/3/4